MLTAAARDRLAQVSTATITTVLFKRGLRNQFLQGPQLVNPDAPRLVGPAYTLRYIPAREDIDVLKVFEDRAHPQRKGVEECPAGAVFVVDSRGDPRAASAGGILLTRLMRRGCAGAVTDGGFRDTPEIARMDFAVYHARPSAPTNLIHHHAVDLNVPIGCGGVAVFPDDWVLVDDDGAVLIPQKLIDEVCASAPEQERMEGWIMGEVEKGVVLPGLYPMNAETKARYEASRKG